MVLFWWMKTQFVSLRLTEFTYDSIAFSQTVRAHLSGICCILQKKKILISFYSNLLMTWFNRKFTFQFFKFQRKHEGVERDLAALEHRVATLGNEASRLCDIHADHAEQIKVKQEEIVKYWSGLTTKAKVSIVFPWNFLKNHEKVFVFTISTCFRIANKIWMNRIIFTDSWPISVTSYPGLTTWNQLFKLMN